MSASNRTVQDILRKSVKGLSAIHGNSYHLRLAIMVILRAYRMHQLDSEFCFTVAVEVAASGKFDDILYHYTSPRLATGTLFIQAKHKLKAGGRDGNVSKPNRSRVESKQNEGSMITERELLTAWNLKSAYSIPMYFLSFLEVDQHLPSESRYVLCTNASLAKSMERYFTIISPQKDNALLFCEDIGATCYQFASDKPFPLLIDTLRDSCFAKLGKVFAEIIVAGKVVTFNDTLVNTFSSLIYECLEPLNEDTSDSSVSTFKFKKDFFNARESTPTGKFLKAIRKEYKTLSKTRKQKHNNYSLKQLKIKIDRCSLTSVTSKRQANICATFDQKVREFYAKFCLVCNSCNEAALREKAITVLGQWCDDERGTVFDNLQGKVLDALKSEKHVLLDLTFVRQCFENIELKPNVSSLKNFSEEYRRSLHLQHSRIEVHPKYLTRSSVLTFLHNKSSWGVYQFTSLLDLTISSYILIQMLSHSNCETVFVDSAKYRKGQDMKTVLEDLLSCRDPTFKVITILGKHDLVSMNEIEELSKKHCQKIVVVEKTTRTPQKSKPLEWYFGNNLKHEAWSKLFKENDQWIFGTVSSLSSMVDDTDDLSFLLAWLELYKQSKELKVNYIKCDYNRIKKHYIHRCVVPYQENKEGNNSRFYQYATQSQCTDRSKVNSALDAQDKEPQPPGIQDGTNAKVHIFLNDAGHGKTYFFTWLAWRLLKYDRSLFVIKFVAKEFSTDFELLEEGDIKNISDTEIVRLLYRYINLALVLPTANDIDINRREAARCAKLLTVFNGQIVVNKAKEKDLSTKERITLRLFREKFNQQKLVLLLDGFDEIVPCYKDAVRACFARFTRLDGLRSLYLSCRPYAFDDELKQTFQHSQFYQLELFSRKTSALSWHKFLQNNLNGYHLRFPSRESRTSHILCDALAYTLNDVITVPLMLYMVQTVLLPEIMEHVDVYSDTVPSLMLDDWKLNMFNLVEAIVDKMIEGFYKDKIGTTYSTFQMNEKYMCIDAASKEILKRHMCLAMHVIFAEKERELLLSVEEKESAEKFMKELAEGKGKTVFIVGVVNREPIFVHFIVAEFFAAHWFYKNRHRFRTESIFKSQAFWSRPLARTRYFFNCLLVKECGGCELHWAILNSSMYRVEDTLYNNPSALTAKDKAGRLPIHLTSCTEALIDAFPFSIHSKDTLCDWTGLDYAFVQNMSCVVNEFFSHGTSANVYTLFQQLCSNDTEVILEQGIEYVSYLEKYVHQTHIANELCELVAQYLINERKANLYSPREKLFSLSMLEYCVKKDNALMFHYLLLCNNSFLDGLRRKFVQPVFETLPKPIRAITGWLRSGSLSTTSQPSPPNYPNPHSFIDRIFELSLREEAYMITFYLSEHRPSFLTKIQDLSIATLVGCAKRAIKTIHVASFRKIFHHLCIKLQIPHVEENAISDDFNVYASFNDDPFGANKVCVDECCLWYATFSYEVLQYQGNKFYKEGFLAHALSVGSVPMLSYLLQKTKTNVTNALIIVLVQLLPLFTKRYKNHNKSTAAFNYLLNKTLDLHIVDQHKRNLLQTIVEHGCLCMVPCLINKGFDPNQFDGYFIDKLFESLTEDRMTSLFTYLQKKECVDVFEPSLLDGHYVIDLAIRHSCNIFFRKLFDEKYFCYHILQRENALIDLLKRMLETYGANRTLYQFNRWKSNQITDGTALEYDVWGSVHSSILKKIPIV